MLHVPFMQSKHTRRFERARLFDRTKLANITCCLRCSSGKSEGAGQMLDSKSRIFSSATSLLPRCGVGGGLHVAAGAANTSGYNSQRSFDSRLGCVAVFLGTDVGKNLFMLGYGLTTGFLALEVRVVAFVRDGDGLRDHMPARMRLSAYAHNHFKCCIAAAL